MSYITPGTLITSKTGVISSSIAVRGDGSFGWVHDKPKRLEGEAIAICVAVVKANSVSNEAYLTYVLNESCVGWDLKGSWSACSPSDVIE